MNELDSTVYMTKVTGLKQVREQIVTLGASFVRLSRGENPSYLLLEDNSQEPETFKTY